MPRKGENIYKRKDGRWEGRYIKEYDFNNKAKYASVYAHSYSEVKQKLSLAKFACSIPENNSDSDSFEMYAIRWLSEMKPQIKHSTYVKYKNIINNHIVCLLGNKKVKEITTDNLKNFVSLKLQEGNVNNKKGLSPKTVKDIISVVKLIMRYAEGLGEGICCDFDQLTIKITNSSEKNISKNTQDILTVFLMNQIDHTKLGILLCLYTGIRIGELCAIRYCDILVNEKIIKITKTMQRLQTFSNDSASKTQIVITEPKSVSSQREIPIPDFLMDIIMTFNYKTDDYILTGRSDKYVEPRTLEYRFKSCLKKCGLSDYKFHQLRHRFATQCIELGFDIKSLSEILGHASVNITLNRYVHASMELKRMNMNKLQCSIAY